MAQRVPKKPERPLGYPSLDEVSRGCVSIAQTQPVPVYLTCTAQLHNPSQRKMAALLQVLKINTLAGMWMLRDIEQHKPEQRFALYRKQKSTRYLTDGIDGAIDKAYRSRLRPRYTLNTYIFNGLCTTVASMTSSYLQKMAEAREKGLLQQYEQSGAYVVKIGKHKGQALRTLGRRTLFGYAFLTPKREQCEEALRHMTLLLSGESDDGDWKQAAKYRMSFGRRRNRELGSMRTDTLRRLKLLVERELDRAEEMDELRKAAQACLRFTPPGFPRIRSDGLSPERQRDLHWEYIEALEDFAEFPDTGGEELLFRNLTEDERQLFRELQRRAYAATNQPNYVPLRWNRADGCVRHRECALVYDPVRRQYLFLAYLLADTSRHKRTLAVHSDLYDVNNPTVALTKGRRPSAAMLFELEFDIHQQQILDQARQEAMRWKDTPETSSGCVRSATLQAHYSEDRRAWWFDVRLSLGFKPTHVERAEHVVGVHVDPLKGVFVSVLGLDGAEITQFHLDEHTIATLLENRDTAQQARLKPQQRTAKERQHRIADALVAICRHYQAQLGVENISYRRSDPGFDQLAVREGSFRTIVALLRYKLALANLPDVFDIKGIAPRRDCGKCGTRHAAGKKQNSMFICAVCGHCEDRHANTAREVARRVLWMLAHKNPSRRQRDAEVPG
jgi:hypothetical protein